MFSKKKREFLSRNFNPNKNYEYKIIFSIKKLKMFYEKELPLINLSPKVSCAVGTELGKLTLYQTKLTPLRTYLIIMIKYLDCETKIWMQGAQSVKKLQF